MSHMTFRDMTMHCNFVIFKQTEQDNIARSKQVCHNCVTICHQQLHNNCYCCLARRWLFAPLHLNTIHTVTTYCVDSTQGRRTQGARGEGIPPLDFGRSVNPWTWLTLSMLEIRGLQHAQLTQYQSEAGQISLLPPSFQIFLGPCHTFILKARYQQNDPQIFIFEFFYIILRVSEGKNEQSCNH